MTEHEKRMAELRQEYTYLRDGDWAANAFTAEEERRSRERAARVVALLDDYDDLARKLEAAERVVGAFRADYGAAEFRSDFERTNEELGRYDSEKGEAGRVPAEKERR